jgi:isocitrate dehydrogenase
VISRLGSRAQAAAVRGYKPLKLPELSAAADFVRPTTRRVVGVDIFMESTLPVAELGASVTALVEGSVLALKMIESRGTKVWPPTGAMTDTVDHYKCRLILRDPAADLADDAVIDALRRISAWHRWMHVEKLNEFDGAQGFTKAQGED